MRIGQISLKKLGAAAALTLSLSATSIQAQTVAVSDPVAMQQLVAAHDQK